jgi:hypothetical protein
MSYCLRSFAPRFKSSSSEATADGSAEEFRFVPDGRYNIVLSGAEAFRIECSRSNFAAEQKQGLLEEYGVRARFEQLSVLLRFALAALDAARTLHSGSPHRFCDVVDKLRN